ncbi:zinc-binding alcohol dehydrogenase family protein [Devosia sp. ZW T5_3]|uniref:quinone oxidoreductase family protein n=1 Tax=Devosia sp. ZW T5_3 TaxID=3378085 RepID=UPI003851C577
MKAAVYSEPGDPEVLHYTDVPDPVVGADDVLISVEAISVEGGDLIHRRLAPPPAPRHVVGYAAAGTVAAVGSNVVNRKVGDRVTSFDLAGSHAAMRSVRASRTWIMPAGLGMNAAAAVPISFGTAHHCLHARGKLQHAETVLILAAAGGVGLAAVQLARRAGATVIAVTSGTDRVGRLKELGANHVIDRKQEDVANAARSLTLGKGVDMVIDPVGSTLQQSLSALASEGRLIFVGNAGGGDLSVSLMPAMGENQSLFGVYMGTQLEKPEVYAAVEQMLGEAAEGKLDVVVDRVFSLEDASAAHNYAEVGNPFGRVIIRPQPR